MPSRLFRRISSSVSYKIGFYSSKPCIPIRSNSNLVSNKEVGDSIYNEDSACSTYYQKDEKEVGDSIYNEDSACSTYYQKSEKKLDSQIYNNPSDEKYVYFTCSRQYPCRGKTDIKVKIIKNLPKGGNWILRTWLAKFDHDHN